MSEKSTVIVSDNGDVVENPMVVVFNKPYTFEGQVYVKVDLSGMEDMTATDMIAANKVLEKTGSFSFMPEMSLEYACIVASKASKLPLEFFYGLSPKEAIKVKNRVTAFFYGTD